MLVGARWPILALFLGWLMLDFGNTSQGQDRFRERDLAALDDKLDRTVSEMGAVESAAVVEIRAPLSGAMLFAISDGSEVNKGDLVAQLDARSIEQELRSMEVELASAKAAVIQAEQLLKQEVVSAATARKLLQRKLALAELRLASFGGKDGVVELTQKNVQDQIDARETEFKAEAAAVEIAKAGVLSGRVDQTELTKLEARLAAAESLWSIAKRELLLVKQKSRVEQAELEFGVLELELSLESEVSEGKSSIALAESKVASAKNVLASVESVVAGLQKQVREARVLSPIEGIVRYGQSRRGVPSVSEGAVVRLRQGLFNVVDPTKLKIAVAVNETEIGKIKVGQDATIQLDAFGPQLFDGKVAGFKRTPEPTSFMQEQVKKYKVFVTFPEPPENVRLGMTAVVEIEVAK